MLDLNLEHLFTYTDWERQKWRDLFHQRGDDGLKISIGPHGDGRFQTVGDLIRHIFSAEKRYVERLSGRPLSDTGIVPTDKSESLFQFGEQTRKDFKKFIATFPAEDWDKPQEFKIANSSLTATPRKIVLHTVLHEIRHWAQVATQLRCNGLVGDFHDFLFSPVLGGELKRG
jgi:uncharacterized damage-inducible protein DinB